MVVNYIASRIEMWADIISDFNFIFVKNFFNSNFKSKYENYNKIKYMVISFVQK